MPADDDLLFADDAPTPADPKFPADATAAGVLWVLLGGLGVVGNATSIARLNFGPPLPLPNRAAGTEGVVTALLVFGACLMATVAATGVRTLRGQATGTGASGAASVAWGLLGACSGVRLLVVGVPPGVAGPGEAFAAGVLVLLIGFGGYLIAGLLALSVQGRYRAWREGHGLSVPPRRGRAGLTAADLESAPRRLPRLAAAAAGVWVALGTLGLANSLALMVAAGGGQPEAPKGQNAPPGPAWPQATPCYGLFALALLPVGCLVLAGQARDVLYSAIASAVVGLAGVLSGLLVIGDAAEMRVDDPPAATALGFGLVALGLVGHLLAALVAFLARDDYLAWRDYRAWQAGAAMRDYLAWREAHPGPGYLPRAPE